MPIVIKELVIKGVVGNQQTTVREGKGLDEQSLARLKKEILQECLDRIERLVDKKSKR